MASTLPKNQLFEALMGHDAQWTAIAHANSHDSFTYGRLVKDVAAGRKWLEQLADSRKQDGKSKADGRCIAFMVENRYDYVVTILSIFASGAIAVPLAPGFPLSELKYVLDHCEAKTLLASQTLLGKAEQLVASDETGQLSLANVEELVGSGHDQEDVYPGSANTDGGMMLYTSGTTSKPKGVLLPLSTLVAQALSLIQAWKYTAHDRVLNVLPLHHIHGTVNALLTPLITGSTIEFLYPFNAEFVWERLAAPYMISDGEKPAENITFFTAVPTIYSRLLQCFSNLSEETQVAAKKAISPKNLRLNISGSAALPVPTKLAWTELSGGNALLERYGMTEVGMALSCGLAFEDRVDGSVGWPLPSVEVRLVDSDTGSVIEIGEEVDKDGKPRQGEIQLRGPTIFEKYWQNPEATSKEFIMDEGGSWFKTGDISIRRAVDGTGLSDQSWAKGPVYFIQGRKSADIIKTGGEKVSALEIEREMLSLPEVEECAVVGLNSDTWGQKVAAVVVLSERGKGDGSDSNDNKRRRKSWSAMDMRRALRERLAAYKIPQGLEIVDVIPKNAMGKVNKKMLVKELFDE